MQRVVTNQLSRDNYGLPRLQPDRNIACHPARWSRGLFILRMLATGMRSSACADKAE